MSILTPRKPIADQHANTAFDHADKAISSLTVAHASAVHEMLDIESQIKTLEDRRAELSVRRDNISRVIDSLDQSLFMPMFQCESDSGAKTPFDFVATQGEEVPEASVSGLNVQLQAADTITVTTERS